MADHTAYHTATDLLGALAARRATSVELVEAAIARIEAGDVASAPSSCATSSAPAPPPQRPTRRWQKQAA